MTGDSQKLRASAMQHYQAGRFAAAIEALMQVVNASGGNNPDSLDDQKRLAAFLFSAGDYRSTAAVMSQVVKLAPDAPNTRDALASACFRLNRLDDVRKHGEHSLQLKDAAAAKAARPRPLPARLPDFSAADRSRNIIAFSLWGEVAKYCAGAVANAEAAPATYPGWTWRFYVDDTVPKPVRDKLAASGAQVYLMQRKNPFDGLFWRFLPINDGNTRHFLVRDADAVINPRERATVEEWLASGKAFHVMRDWWTHTEVMLEGMWGGVGGVLPPLTSLLKDFRSPSLANWHLDQWFLRQMVWPTARTSCMVHDSKFRCLGARDFPAGSDLTPGRHVGQDTSVHSGR